MKNTATGKKIKKRVTHTWGKKYISTNVPQTADINMYFESALNSHCCGLSFFYMEKSHRCRVLTNQKCPWAGRI